MVQQGSNPASGAATQGYGSAPSIIQGGGGPAGGGQPGTPGATAAGLTAIPQNSKPGVALAAPNKTIAQILNDLVSTYTPLQQTVTLAPNGVTGMLGYSQPITIQTINASTVALLTQLVIDTIPGAVSVQLTGNTYNIAQFGVINSANFVTTSRWIGNNILSDQMLTIVGRAMSLNLAFTNLTFGPVVVTVNYVLGNIDREMLQSVMSQFGVAKQLV